jgi:glycosyltransferase involved in cell wall biosynthesis
MTAGSAPQRRPRVVFLNNEILPYRIPLFQALHDRADLESCVLFSTRRSSERKWRIVPGELGFPHRILPGICLHPPKAHLSEKRSIYINPTLIVELARLHPDVVVAYEFSVPSMTALLYARITGRPLLIWSECTGITDRHLTRDQRWARRVLIPRAQGFFGTSLLACRNLVALGAPPERVIEAPQVHQVKWIMGQADRFRGQSKASGETVLYVGSLIERKGVGLLLRAFARASTNRPSIRLRIVGSGPLQMPLTEQVRQLGLQNRVEFTGFIQPADIPREYAGADVFVLPSLEDTFAVVVVEAMACGTPVICSQFAGVTSYLEDGRNAFIINPKDTELLAERILRVLDDRPLRDRFIEQGRNIAMRFEAQSVAEVFAGEILRAAGRGKA